MVAQNGLSANRDLTWPALTGKRELRGGDGIGRHVACWIAENLGYVVIAMVPIAKAEGRKQPYETWGDAKPGRSAGIASEYRSPFEIMRARHFRMKCGVGILAGKSGLVVIDIDDEDAWEEFVNGREMPRTMELSSRPGHRHIIFRDETGISFKTQGGQLAPGVDVRGRGGLFVVYDPGQPERHFTDLTEPAELPDWLREAMPRAGTRGHRKATANSSKRKLNTVPDVREMANTVIPPGKHNDWLRSKALSLANKGWTKNERDLWYGCAAHALARSNEGTDANGNVREPFSDEQIMAYFDTALEIVASENGNGKSRNLVKPLSSVGDEVIQWLWSGYLARGQGTMLDGEKGVAKTSITAEVGSLLTRGLPLPGMKEGKDPVNIIVFTYESSVAQELRQRYAAAGADMSRVFIPDLDAMAEMNKEISEDDENEEEEIGLELPGDAAIFGLMIEQANASLAIWDPINDFLSAGINTHNDASVRRALRPLGTILESNQCAGWMLRHMNKDSSLEAKYRGAGSTAYQNRARVHLIASEIPPELGQQAGYALAIDSSNLRRVNHNQSLAYDIVDSDIVADDEGFFAPKIEWRGIIPVGANALTMRKKKHGPEAYIQEQVQKVLVEMFREKDTWPVKEIEERLAEHDLHPDDSQKDAVKKRMMIRSFRPKGENSGQWYWTINPRIGMRKG